MGRRIVGGGEGILLPKKVFFTKGVGYHTEKLISFELALRSAGIERFNLVYVSSILPPKCEIIEKEEGLKYLSPGQIVFCVMSQNSTDVEGKFVSAAVGVAKVNDDISWGYIAEHHSESEDSGIKSEKMALYMLSTSMGINGVEFGTSSDRDDIERAKKNFLAMGYEVKTFNLMEFARCRKDGEWVTVISSAVFII